MNRRDLLTTGPLAALSAALAAGDVTAATAQAVPALARAEDEDPILPIYRQWVAARKEWYRSIDLPENDKWDMPESKAAEAIENDAFWAMIDMTPTSMAGIAALIHVLWDLDGPGVPADSEDFLGRVDDPPCKLMAAIWRGASGQQGLPPDSRMETVV